MGQARQRGTFEQRRKAAMAKAEELARVDRSRFGPVHPRPLNKRSAFIMAVAYALGNQK